jgi:hypothetical protein
MKTQKLLNICTRIVITGAAVAPALAQQQLSWSQATNGSDAISNWLRTIILAVMACFIMASIIVGALAFKALASDGNWKDFWSKIAGAIGMFVTPVAIYWVAGKS